LYYLYILKCSDGTLYTGVTNNLENRMKVHNSGKGSKYVRTRLPFEVVYTEEHEDKVSAMKREYVVKQMNRSEKVKLINAVSRITKS
jgi:putative endonuclease